MTRQRVLLVGNASHHEFCEPVAWLREYCDLTVSNDIAAAFTQLKIAGDPPDVIVIAAARTELFTQHDVASLLRLAPLARFIGLMGGWCEGELRSGHPWRGVTRVYWHEFIPRLATELTGVNSRGRLAMPRTFTESEFSRATVPVPVTNSHGLLVVRAASLETYESIANACRVIDQATVWESPGRPTFTTGTTAGIWDTTALCQFEAAELERFAKQIHPAPVIAMIGFPRASDRQLAFDCGASSVVPKPYLLQSLWTEFARVLNQCVPIAERTSAA